MSRNAFEDIPGHPFGDMQLIRLDNPVRNYAWGSRTTIAALQGRPFPTTEPEAEIWIGAHPAAPSRVTARTDLLAAIEADRSGILGPERDRLPFLLKVLAVAKPLSIQVHPDSQQAVCGFTREESLGIPRDDPTRNYRDDWPKPELLYAVTDFDALCGIREPRDAARLLRDLPGERLQRIAGVLEERGPGETFDLLNSWPINDRRALVAEVRIGGTQARMGETEARMGESEARMGESEVRMGGPEAALRAAARIAADQPDDPGCVTSLLLNLVTLTPGQALYARPRTIHAYLHGTAVEIMASSDNVLRGGLTPKHVDQAELAAVADFTPTKPEVIEPVTLPTGEEMYPAPVEQFQLTRLRPRPLITIPDPGPSAILGLVGSLTVTRGDTTHLLNPGEALFAPHNGDNKLTIGGQGLGFRASIPTFPATG
ncbi:mannose-6-phosphate isomerase, class I [Actinomadura sp. 6N118]|uniref:mannose-6-phosphate isomerase, class I n=1 Tax=Actinomadura sp. 6N118 TaxID=3375151 RepID=UPI0037AEE911